MCVEGPIQASVEPAGFSQALRGLAGQPYARLAGRAIVEQEAGR